MSGRRSGPWCQVAARTELPGAINSLARDLARVVRRTRVDIVFAGDSLTAGMHASDHRRSYPALVVTALTTGAGRPASMHLAGLPGGRVEDLLRRRAPVGRRLVVVELGTNDWVGYRPRGPWRATPIAEFQASYARLLQRLVGRGAPVLICMGVWGPSGGCSEVGAALDGFDRVIAAECEARGGRFVPLSAIHDDPDARGPAGRSTPLGVSDETHPNDRGHALIAGMVVAAAGR